MQLLSQHFEVMVRWVTSEIPALWEAKEDGSPELPIHLTESHLHHSIKPRIHPSSLFVTRFFWDAGQNLRIQKAVTLALCLCRKTEGGLSWLT
ncbi:hypothetical protein AAY473_000606 [Plecturocebus cupreus]